MVIKKPAFGLVFLCLWELAAALQPIRPVYKVLRGHCRSGLVPRKGPQSGPKILNKKDFSDDWQVPEPPCKEIYTNVAVF
ncbi:hypothetical protein P3W49_29010, partial [Pseudomonas putida]|uniref:hypothetical protein n=1 Tax=Pseudomonas putida TaxID=303 RepID=UPI0023E3BA35